MLQSEKTTVGDRKDALVAVLDRFIATPSSTTVSVHISIYASQIEGNTVNLQ